MRFQKAGINALERFQKANIRDGVRRRTLNPIRVSIALMFREIIEVCEFAAKREGDERGVVSSI